MLSNNIKSLIPNIQSYLSQQPVEKAWLFGSCSRGEEQKDSDIDILVRYSPGERITLFTICRISLGLEEVVMRPVDLVEEGRLLQFAQENVERDKILIYERAS